MPKFKTADRVRIIDNILPPIEYRYHSIPLDTIRKEFFYV